MGLISSDTPTAQFILPGQGTRQQLQEAVRLSRSQGDTGAHILDMSGGPGMLAGDPDFVVGADVQLDDVSQYAGNCMVRTPPPRSRTLFQRLQRAFGGTVAEYIVQ